MFDPLKEPGSVQPGRLHSFTFAEGLREEPDAAELHNGIAWSGDAKTFYLSHSNSGGIIAFDYEENRGAISNRRVFATVPAEMRDGAAVQEVPRFAIGVDRPSIDHSGVAEVKPADAGRAYLPVRRGHQHRLALMDRGLCRADLNLERHTRSSRRFTPPARCPSPRSTTSGPPRIGRTMSVPSTARREKGYAIGEDPFDLIVLADVGY
jgi:hypothetical protein